MKPKKKKLISFRTDPEIHRTLRLRAAAEEKTIEKVAAEALKQYLYLPHPVGGVK